MKRRFFALLAVPALALGFALASPGTDQAHAYPSVSLSPDTVCAIARSQIHIAHDGGDDGAADVFYGNAVAYGCNEWDLV
jgi:hypothetical protein